jgi:hypothetical protein
MHKSFHIVPTAFLAAIFLVGLLVVEAMVQPQSTSPRAALTQAVQEQAQRDVKFGTAPADVTKLTLLFGDDARTAGTSPRDLLTIYEDAFRKAKESQSWWDSIAPKTGWGIAAVTFFLGLIAATLKDSTAKLLQTCRDILYRRLAGHKWLRRKALAHYRLALIEKYRNIKIPFRPDQPLNM